MSERTPDQRRRDERRPVVTDVAGYARALGDDALILSQRCAEWLTRAPELEEDVALANIALDLLGQARLLLGHAGEAEGDGRDEDDLAYFRDERQFTNLQLCELPNEDFAVSMARLLIFSCYQRELYRSLAGSSADTLAAIATKAGKEVAYHVEHAAMWVRRLGDGTAESHRRMQHGLERVWPYVDELFDDSWLAAPLVDRGIAVRPSTLRRSVTGAVESVIAEATLSVPQTTAAPGGGRFGLHTEAFGYLLAEFQHLTRSHPGARW